MVTATSHLESLSLHTENKVEPSLCMIYGTHPSVLKIKYFTVREKLRPTSNFNMNLKERGESCCIPNSVAIFTQPPLRPFKMGEGDKTLSKPKTENYLIYCANISKKQVIFHLTHHARVSCNIN